MTAIQQPESKPTSRRALLAGALGGLGALAASVIGRTSPVRAGVDGDVVLDANNPAATTTQITNSSSTDPVFWGNSTSGGIGILGSSDSYIGVYGFSSGTIHPGTVGWSRGNSTGVQGYSNGVGGNLPAAPAKTGVFGYAAQDAASVGVRGESPAGFGVYGKTTGTGFAGYFNGKVYMTQFLEMGEIAAPATPAANKARLYIKDNGLGKTQLVVKFANGTFKVLATES